MSVTELLTPSSQPRFEWREKFAKVGRVRELRYVEAFLFALVLVIGIFWLFQFEAPPHFNFVRVALIVGVLAIVFAVVAYARVRFFDPTEIQAERLKADVHSQFKKLKLGIQKLSQLQSTSATSARAARESALNLVSTHVSTVLDGLALVASNYAGKEAAVSVKLFYMPAERDGVPMVRTFARNAKSLESRRRAPRKFPYNGNTAFLSIVEQNSPRASFKSADLLALYRSGDYKNLHEQWRLHYTSTAVFPICDRNEEKLSSLIGFLCVDTYAGDVTHPRLLAFLPTMADEIYQTMTLIHQFALSDRKNAA